MAGSFFFLREKYIKIWETPFLRRFYTFKWRGKARFLSQKTDFYSRKRAFCEIWSVRGVERVSPSVMKYGNYQGRNWSKNPLCRAFFREAPKLLTEIRVFIDCCYLVADPDGRAQSNCKSRVVRWVGGCRAEPNQADAGRLTTRAENWVEGEEEPEQ